MTKASSYNKKKHEPAITSYFHVSTPQNESPKIRYSKSLNLRICGSFFKNLTVELTEKESKLEGRYLMDTRNHVPSGKF